MRARVGRTRRPARPVLDLLIELDTGADHRPLHLQVYDGVRTAILAGRLEGGVRLPSTRALATMLRVSRLTVITAFDQLRAEGYIEGRRGSGTFVCGVPPDDALRARRPTAASGQQRAAVSRMARREPEAVRARPGLVGASAASSVPECTAFQPGLPALELFPAETWARLIAKHWRRAAVPSVAAELLGYGDPRGYAPLRKAIASYLTTSRSARCTADQVIVTTGAQQALDLVARVLLEPSDAAWMEEPGYSGVRDALLAARTRIAPVPLDSEGLDIAAGTRLAPNPRLVYVSPSHQHPTGVTMSASRRLELLKWAAKTGAWVVEDDYDSEFRYTARPLACLQGMDAEAHGIEHSRVLYVGTLSKALCPALRIGYLVVPPALLDRIVAAKLTAGRATPLMEQAALADFIDEGHFARHLRRARILYADRQRALIDAVHEHLSDWIDVAPADAGMHLVAPLRPSLARRGVADRDVATAARARGIIAQALSSPQFTSSRRRHAAGGALVLGYAGFSAAVLDASARRLHEVFRDTVA